MTTSLLMSKIIDISAARGRRSGRTQVRTMTEQEKRSEQRHPAVERLFVQIVSSDDADLIGTTLSCATLDVSAGGLRIQTTSEIPVGCQLDLWIDNSAGPGKFFLSSDVRWAIQVETGYQAGVELHEGAATDIAAWRSQYS